MSWIKAQDGNLINTNDVSVIVHESKRDFEGRPISIVDKNHIKAVFTDGKVHILGEYQNKETCLAVIDYLLMMKEYYIMPDVNYNVME